MAVEVASVPARSGRLRGLLINLAVAVGSVLVMLVGAEVTLRLAGFQTKGSWSEPCYEPQEGFGHLFKPGFEGTMYKGISSGWKEIPVRINSQGLRGPEFAPAKPAGVRRVLVLGDSFTFGYLLPQEESYPAQLQQIFDERLGTGRVEVINAGIPGYGLPNERRYLQHRGLALDPDVVILTASPGDVSNPGIRNPEDGQPMKNKLKRELRIYHTVRSSSLLTFMQYLFFRLLHTTDPRLELGRGLHAAEPNPNVQRAWQRYAEGFAKLADLVEGHDATLLLVAYPGEMELFSDNTVMHDRWRDLAVSNGAHFVELLPEFKARRLERLFLPADGHPNAASNEIVARTVADVLAAVGVVQSSS